jgi:2,3-bisphosphoglycerate-dependent phosphoglycerate mutase
MKFYALRHGKTKMNELGIINGILDEPLIDEGILQANEAAQHIPSTVTTIVASPLRRAQHTADIIAKHLNLTVTTDERLREVNLGSLAGKRWDEMPDGEKLKIKHRDMQYDYTSFGGEAAKDVAERIKDFVE